MSTPDFYEQYTQKSDLFQRYDAGIDARLRKRLGEDWILLDDDSLNQHLTKNQQLWRFLRYYHSCMANSGDFIRYAAMVYERPEFFSAIVAMKTLKAASDLRPLFDQMAAFPGVPEQDAFWHDSRGMREPIEAQADTITELLDLLNKFASAHPEDFDLPPPPDDPLENMFEYMNAMRRRIHTLGVQGHFNQQNDKLE